MIMEHLNTFRLAAFYSIKIISSYSNLTGYIGLLYSHKSLHSIQLNINIENEIHLPGCI